MGYVQSCVPSLSRVRRRRAIHLLLTYQLDVPYDVKKGHKEGGVGKTTVAINETLIREAMRATNLKTKKEVIETGLRELLRMKNRELLRRELGTFDINLSLEELKKKRAGK